MPCFTGNGILGLVRSGLVLLPLIVWQLMSTALLQVMNIVTLLIRYQRAPYQYSNVTYATMSHL